MILRLQNKTRNIVLIALLSMAMTAFCLFTIPKRPHQSILYIPHARNTWVVDVNEKGEALVTAVVDGKVYAYIWNGTSYSAFGQFSPTCFASPGLILGYAATSKAKVLYDGKHTFPLQSSFQEADARLWSTSGVVGTVRVTHPLRYLPIIWRNGKCSLIPVLPGRRSYNPVTAAGPYVTFMVDSGVIAHSTLAIWNGSTMIYLPTPPGETWLASSQSLDGSFYGTTRDAGGRTNLWVSRSPAFQFRKLFTTFPPTKDIIVPLVSPNGKWLAYVYYDSSGFTVKSLSLISVSNPVRLYEVDGVNPRAVTNTGAIIGNLIVKPRLLDRIFRTYEHKVLTGNTNGAVIYRAAGLP